METVAYWSGLGVSSALPVQWATVLLHIYSMWHYMRPTFLDRFWKRKGTNFGALRQEHRPCIAGVQVLTDIVGYLKHPSAISFLSTSFYALEMRIFEEGNSFLAAPWRWGLASKHEHEGCEQSYMALYKYIPILTPLHPKGNVEALTYIIIARNPKRTLLKIVCEI